MDTIEIPGGTAVLRDTLTVRQRRPLQIVSATMSGELREKITATAEKAEDELNLLDLGVTERDATTIFRMQDASIISFLDSWTLDQPLPTLDTVGDLDTSLYDALALAVAARGAASIGDVGEFGPDGSPDQASPTGPSDD